jgi:NAD(P)H-hydrate epimerase
VTVAFVGKETSMSQETKVQKKICENCGIKISSNYREAEYTTIVDAIFGIGLSRNVEGDYAKVISWINEQRAFVAAVDLPSGISSENGRVMGCAVRADLTVTFAFRKLGQILYPGTLYCGKTVCREIGIPMAPSKEDKLPVFCFGSEDLRRIPARMAYSNKGTYGKVLLIAGSEGMSGAAYLAGLASYRSGCGLVRIFTPGCNRQVMQTQLPEAIVTAWEMNLLQEQLKQALAWADVVGIGPGFGTGEIQREILEAVLRTWKGALVIDADGLNLLAKDLTLLHETKAKVIVTPHIGEMSRLQSVPKETILSDLIGTAKAFAEAHQVVCVLKDARTIVSDGSQVMVNTSGNSGMAVGGAGDVLTGVICGLLAQGMAPFDAAALGVYLHGLSGDAACRRHGAYGMIARDIANETGMILQSMEKAGGK